MEYIPLQICIHSLKQHRSLVRQPLSQFISQSFILSLSVSQILLFYKKQSRALLQKLIIRILNFRLRVYACFPPLYIWPVYEASSVCNGGILLHKVYTLGTLWNLSFAEN